MLLFSSAHIHGCGAEEQEVCQECSHHKVHNSHLTKAKLGLHECVLCKLLQVTYLTPTPLCIAVPQCIAHKFLPHADQHVETRAMHARSPRAPPVV